MTRTRRSWVEPRGRLRPVVAFVMAAAAIVAACTPMPRQAAVVEVSPPVSSATAPAAPASATTPAPSATPTPFPSATLSPSPEPGEVTLIGAGDIARCPTGKPVASSPAAATARLVEAAGPTALVFTAGDNAYPSGSGSDFASCYDRTWGAFRARTFPAAGNHDWQTPGAAAYHAYFGAVAGPPGQTWYTFNAGAWRVIVLDSDCAYIGGCGPTSPEGTWLAAELAAHQAACTMAIWHHPIFSSSKHGDDPTAVPLWDVLQAAGAELVVNGHDHVYERFAPQDSSGRATPTGIQEIVVGTGGGSHYGVRALQPNSLAQVSDTFGVLRLELWAGGYSWAFVSAPDGTVKDTGTALCH